MKKSILYFLKILLLGFGIVPLFTSLLCIVLFIFGFDGQLGIIPLVLIFAVCLVAVALLMVKLLARNLPDSFIKRYLPVLLPLLITLAACAVCMVVSKGFIGHGVFIVLLFAEIAFYPVSFIMFLMGSPEFIFILPLVYQVAFLLFFVIRERRLENRPKLHKRFAAVCLSLLLVFSMTIGWVQVVRSQTVLRPDYGFQYGGGYASVDIYRYSVTNSDNILSLLDKPSSFIISDKNKMPVLDGAEAAYPVYSAFANACYEGVADQPDYYYKNSEDADRQAASLEPIASEIITFTNTIYAFERLINGEVDIFFGAQPSKAQLELAERAGKKLVFTPIGKDAFVFFVSNTNECNNLTPQNIQDIYSGEIKNWKPITGKDEKIIAFQRPENSGSQTIMQMIMGDVPLAEPLLEEFVSGMGDISENVADYRNYPGAIGYSFRFFTTGMADNSDEIKLLSINWIAPTTENIASSIYPYTATLYAITLEDNDLETIAPFLEWMQGSEGQELIEKIGYVPIAYY